MAAEACSARINKGLSTVCYAHSADSEEVRPLHKHAITGLRRNLQRVREKLSLLRLFPQIRLDVPPESFHHFFLAAFLDFSLNFLEREVHDVVAVHPQRHPPF